MLSLGGERGGKKELRPYGSMAVEMSATTRRRKRRVVAKQGGKDNRTFFPGKKNEKEPKKTFLLRQ